MKMNFDLETPLAAPFALAAGNHPGETFDWYDLRARMAAAYATRHVLELEKARETSIPMGSFDRGSARVMADYGMGPSEGLERINPTGLANGNSGCDNKTAAANANVAGD